MTKHHVIVYGTLKRGRGNHHRLEKAKFLGEVVTEPKFTMYDLGYFPGVRKEGSTAIHGELYEINDLEFKSLDSLEGYPHLYVREQIRIPGRTETPWIYIINRDYLREEAILEDGVWPRQQKQ